MANFVFLAWGATSTTVCANEKFRSERCVAKKTQVAKKQFYFCFRTEIVFSNERLFAEREHVQDHSEEVVAKVPCLLGRFFFFCSHLAS